MSENGEATVASGLNANALTPLNAARLLTKVSGHAITAEIIQADVAAGAQRTPTARLTWFITPRGLCGRWPKND